MLPHPTIPNLPEPNSSLPLIVFWMRECVNYSRRVAMEGLVQSVVSPVHCREGVYWREWSNYSQSYIGGSVLSVVFWREWGCILYHFGSSGVKQKYGGGRSPVAKPQLQTTNAPSQSPHSFWILHPLNPRNQKRTHHREVVTHYHPQ